MRLITKASGEKEPFDIKKFRRSLLRSGASEKTIKELAKKIEKNKKIKTTHDVYKYAFNYLSSAKTLVAARYNLKNALFELGPSGFPFEKFMSKLFEYKDYKVKTNQTLPGKCITHEVDMVLEKGKKHYFVESKFHNNHGLKSDVKVTLYAQARFEDLQAYCLQDSKNHKTIYKAWCVTNTKFTTEAVKYAKCVKMKLMDWNYPSKGGLAYLIDSLGIHPITALSSLSKKQKKALIKEGIVLCRQLLKNRKALKDLGLKKDKIEEILKDSKKLCSINQSN